MLFDPILVITRPKKNGIGAHWGVLFPNGYVYHYTAEDGLCVTTLEEFAGGADVTIIREIAWHQAMSVRARLDELALNPRRYDLLNWNCETFAEWLTSGVPKSGQVVGALVVAAIFTLLAVAK